MDILLGEGITNAHNGDVEYIFEPNFEEGSDTAFCVFHIKDPKIPKKSHKCKGSISKEMIKALQSGSVALQGRWLQNVFRGKSEKVFQFNDIIPSLGSSKNSATEYLYTVEGITAQRLKHIINKLGGDAVSKIIEDPNSLDGIPRLPAKTAAKIRETIISQKQDIIAISKLSELGFSGKAWKMREKILAEFPPEKLIEILDTDPYALLSVKGIGFKLLDTKLLESKKITKDNPNRKVAAISHVLEKAAMEGNTWETSQQISRRLKKIGIEGNEKELDEFAMQAVQKRYVVKVEGGYALPEHAVDESTIAEIIQEQIQKTDGNMRPSTRHNTLNSEQLAALNMVLQNPCSVVTGIPGSGKTFTTKAIVETLNQFSNSGTILCAPTGKAAKRLSEATGCRAITIHSLIGRLKSIDKAPIVKNLIIDEASMVSASLMAELLTAVTERERDLEKIVLIGDVDQLPSIAAGRVLGDIIDSDLVPVSKLEELQRSKKDSYIAINARKVRKGEMIISGKLHEDFTIANEATIQSQIDLVKRGFGREIKDPVTGKAADPISDIQVIAPKRADCFKLNNMLQAILNPQPADAPCLLKRGYAKQEDEEKENDTEYLYEGDKVLITKNNKQLGVVNGDVGRVESLIWTNKFVTGVRVKLDSDAVVEFGADNINTVTRGYAITIHKSQGSEAPIVLVCLGDENNGKFFSRNLFYTAITRGKHKVCVLGSEKAIRACIANVDPTKRQTKLADMITGKEPTHKPSNYSKAVGTTTVEPNSSAQSRQLDLHKELNENSPPIPSMLGGYMPEGIHPDYLISTDTLDGITAEDLLSIGEDGEPLVFVAARNGHLPYIKSELLTDEVLTSTYSGHSVIEVAAKRFNNYEYEKLAWEDSPILLEATKRLIHKQPVENRAHMAGVIAAANELDEILGLELPQSAAEAVGQDWWDRNAKLIEDKKGLERREQPGSLLSEIELF